jgi:hypothetical protein
VLRVAGCRRRGRAACGEARAQGPKARRPSPRGEPAKLAAEGVSTRSRRDTDAALAEPGYLDQVFECNYCGTQHDDEDRGDEHIIGEKLGNRSLLLPNTCAYWNNFFARSFESEVLNWKFMNEALLRAVPERRPSGTKPLGTVNRADGTTLYRWLVDGKEELRQLPERQNVQTLSVPALDAAGNTHQVEIAIPAELTVAIKHLPRERAYEERARRKLEESRAAVEDYVRRVTRDPSLDAGLTARLDAKGLTLQPVKELNAVVERVPGGPPTTVDDLVPQNVPITTESLIKFFLKIGWCFACLRLGRKKLMDLGGDLVLAYLESGAIEQPLVDRCRTSDPAIARQLVREAAVYNETVWFWAPTADDSIPLIARLGDAGLREDLRTLANRRREEATFFMGTIPDLRPRSFEKDLPPEGERRHHRLELLYQQGASDLEAIYCRVVLFGGLFDVHAQVTRAAPVGGERCDLGGPVRIDF